MVLSAVAKSTWVKLCGTGRAVSTARCGLIPGVIPDRLTLALTGKELQKIAPALSGMCYYTVVCHLPGGVEVSEEAKAAGGG